MWARADRLIMNDSSGPRRIARLIDELGGIEDPDRVLLAADHFTPPASDRHREILSITRSWARERGIRAFYDGEGILHNLVLEKHQVAPGMLLVGADSHTGTAGAVGAVAVPVGSTELATVLATGEVWLRVPQTIRVDLAGQLGAGVDVRDLTLRILGDLGTRFANYRAIEYGGSGVDPLGREARLVLANQGIEMGAKNAIVTPGADQREQLTRSDVEVDGVALEADPDAKYEARYRYDLESLVPMVARPGSPGHAVVAGEAVGEPIDRVWIGSCAGGRRSDVIAAAEVLVGRRVRIRTTVTPASGVIEADLRADGTLGALEAAGCVVLRPGCGACAGIHSGVARAGERIFSTGTRNFPGRMGHRDAEIYLGSAYTAAAVALAGRVVDPREVMT